MAMLGDAISHAVLPGIAIAFLLSGSRSPAPMLLGAGALGVITTFAIETLHRRGRLQQDASIGVTFTWLFALGVILITVFAGQVDLDQECVLYGEIAYVPLDQWVTDGGTVMGPRAVWTLGALFVANLAFVVFGYKELKITAFDPALATSLGISATLWHYLLMGMVSLTTVGAFESVGAILVVAMLVVPAAAAYLITDRLGRMLVYAVVLGALASGLGYLLASLLNGSIAGAIAVVAGLEFLVAMIFAPRHGLIARLRGGTVAALPEPPAPLEPAQGSSR